jgi:phage terminase Nu1 subunit (DNA packaging protein)
MDKTEETFWIVADANFPTKISYRHPTLASAQAEAIRLAKAHDEKFVVFESICAYEINTVSKTWYQVDVDIPF